MAGSLQARAAMTAREGVVDVEPDVCPMSGQGAATARACMRSYLSGEQSVCVYAYAFTEVSDPTERIGAPEMIRWMLERANYAKRVRVLCLAAKPVDRAGA